MCHDGAEKSLGEAALLSGEDQEPQSDIRVELEMIWMTVMLVVLLGPPAIADGGQQGTQQAKDIRLPGGLKHLPVTGVMPHEGNLGEHKREKCSIQHLHPEEIRRHQEAHGQNEETQILQSFASVIHRLPVEQSLLGEELPQLGILMGVRVRLHPARPLKLMLLGSMEATPLLSPETGMPWPSNMGRSL